MLAERFVMLGKTVPEQSSDGRIMVCSAGYDMELRTLLRIYPLAMEDAPRQWSISSVRLERNPQDSRHESWKLADERRTTQHHAVNSSFMRHEHLSIQEPYRLLEHTFVSSIAEANDRRLSLAMIAPVGTPVLNLEWHDDHPDAPQLQLFEGHNVLGRKVTDRFPCLPRLRFRDDAGEHNLQLRDWGLFELMRKRNAYDESLQPYLAGALKLSADSCLLVGNLSNQRTVWLVIGVLNMSQQPTLFDLPTAAMALT